MPKNVQLPDGSVVEFPDGMSDDAIGGAIKQHLASTPTPPADMSKVAGAPSTGLPQPPTQVPANMKPSLLGRDTNPGPVANFAKGAAKGALKTISSADDFAASKLPAFMTTPIGQAPTAENSARAVQTAKNLAMPHGTAQKVGLGTEQAAEFLAPTGIEEGAAKLGGAALGKWGGLFGKLAGSGLHSGTINATQGGSFGTGAGAGVAGSLFGMGLQKVAPALAETAMGVRATDRAYGRTPGQAIMAETTGTNPGSIAQQAATKSAGYTDTLNDNALQSNVPVDLQPSRNIAASFLDTAVKRNNPSTIKEIGAIGDQLGSRPGIGPIPQTVSADEGLALRRGIDDLQGSWNPNLTRSLSDTAVNGTRQELATQLERAIPDYRPLNSKISTLIPVAQRAGAADLNAGVMQRVIGRAAKPTGALVGAATGGGIGYKETGNMEGAALGAGLGLFAPELLTSPKTLMMGARGMASPVTQKALLPFATGAGLQAAPKKKGLFQ